MRTWLINQLEWLRYLNRNLGFWNGLKFRLAEIVKKSTVKIKIHGIFMLVRPKTPDISVAIQSLGSEFEPIRDFLPHDFEGVIVDAGGYIGSAAIKLSDMYPLAKICSIEAAEQNFIILQYNVRRNNRIDKIKAALSPQSDIILDIRDRGTGQWGFTAIKRSDDAPNADVIEKVKTITIKEISDRYPGKEIGLIKLDIEGGEKALFEDAAKEISNIPFIFVELHDRIVDGCTEAFKRLSKDRNVVKFNGEKYLSYAKSAQGVAIQSPDEKV